MRVMYLSYFSPPHLNVAANRSRRFAQYLARAGCDVQLIREQCSSRFVQQASSACWQHEALISSQAVASWNIEWSWRWPTIFHKMGYHLWLGGVPVQDGEIAKHYWLVDLHWGWIVPSLWQCCQQIIAHRPDVILVSCPPFSSSIVGYYLSRWFDLPLVLDFRDGWSRASYFSEGKTSQWEKRVLRQAARLIVTSQSDWLAYQRLVGEEKVAWIPNSYDFIIDHVSERNTVFTIGYSGTWDGFRRSAKGILSQLAKVPFAFRFINVGDCQSEFCHWVENFGLKDSVVMTGLVEKSQVQDILSQCNALFIQKGAPDNGKTDTHLATKAIDYVASGRPILAELPEGETLSFLRHYAGQLYEVNDEYTQEYQQQLTVMHQQWQRDPKRSYRPSEEFYRAFDAQRLSSRLYRVLNEARI